MRKAGWVNEIGQYSRNKAIATVGGQNVKEIKRDLLLVKRNVISLFYAADCRDTCVCGKLNYLIVFAFL